MQKIYILVGSPASGKSWISRQLATKFKVLEHDNYMSLVYPEILIEEAKKSSKPILANTPFGLSGLMASLMGAHVPCEPVFVIEPEATLKSRYMAREHKEIPKGHLTRQFTYMQRARELNSFVGNSEQVLKHLESIGR